MHIIYQTSLDSESNKFFILSLFRSMFILRLGLMKIYYIILEY